MGLLDAIFGSKSPRNVEVVPDWIWMTADAKFAGIEKETEQPERADTIAILLVAHFPDVLARLETLVEQRSGDVPCKAVLASNLKTDLAAVLKLDESAVIDVIVGERHPLPSVDDQLEEFASELPCRCRFSHHVSLEDAVISVFAGETVKELLIQMGMEEGEAIESQMVSRRIRKTQQKIEGRAGVPHGAESAAEWLEKNCPDLV